MLHRWPRQGHYTSEGKSKAQREIRMTSVYALIPAALLAGTILASPAHARVEDPDIHAQRVSAQKETFRAAKARTAGTFTRTAGRQRYLAVKARTPKGERADLTRTAETNFPKTTNIRLHKVASSKLRKVASIDAP